jgi:hypothetical protein
MKIHILYRHYNVEGAGNKSRPSWFDYEKCFVNLLNTIEGKNVDLHVIMDGNSAGNFIENYKDKYTLHSINAGGDYNSYLETYRYIKMLNIDNNDLIYFLENDYLHLPNSDKILSEGTNIGADYVSLYDHPDKYIDGANPFVEGGGEYTKVFLSESCHWKLTNSTTMTFAAKVKTLREDEPILRKWTNTTHPHDFQMFLELRDKGRSLITPIPGYTTHGETAWLTPLINWNDICNNTNV